MEKSDFLQRKKQIEDNIYQLKNELSSLKAKYIESNQKFEIGELIQVIIPKIKFQNRVIEEEILFGYVDGFDINYSGQVQPILFKQTKNGTKSKFRLYTHGGCIFSKIEKDKI